mgnify:CR=1 FL=1
MELAVVIVTWNTRDLVLGALRSLQADLSAHGPQAAIWVVDNASTDDTVEAIQADFPQAHVIASDKNLGFAAGNNLALRALGFDNDGVGSERLPQAVFLLNPDTVVHMGATRTLYEALFARPGVGLVGARLSYADGAFQHSAFRFPGIWQAVVDLFPVPGRLYESALNGRYPRRLYEAGLPFPVDHTLGATMMIRGEVLRQVGLFDERFFMYCEEIDLSMRIRRAGWDIYCVPGAHITHLEGRSTSQVRPQSFLNLWRSRYRLYEKHYSPLKVALLRQIVRLGMRRKIAQARRDGTLTAEERAALVAAYQAVAAL